MNYSQTNAEYLNAYPYVLRGEQTPQPNSSTGMSNTMEVYPAVCNTRLDTQYNLPNVGPIPVLDCPNASGTNKIYSEIHQRTPDTLTSQDKKWGYTDNNTLIFKGNESLTYGKCLPQFNNSIEICNPLNCGIGSPNQDYLQAFECNKLWNNNTKRRFIDARKSN